MGHYLAALGAGTALGVAVVFAAFRISEQFDTQLIPF